MEGVGSGTGKTSSPVQISDCGVSKEQTYEQVAKKPKIDSAASESASPSKKGSASLTSPSAASPQDSPRDGSGGAGSGKKKKKKKSKNPKVFLDITIAGVKAGRIVIELVSICELL